LHDETAHFFTPSNAILFPHYSIQAVALRRAPRAMMDCASLVIEHLAVIYSFVVTHPSSPGS
jgi:hypothetical protein